MKYSVIIRNRNEEKYIGHCIQSIDDFLGGGKTGQDIRDHLQIILMDNESTDNTIRIVNRFEYHDITKLHIKSSIPQIRLEAFGDTDPTYTDIGSGSGYLVIDVNNPTEYLYQIRKNGEPLFNVDQDGKIGINELNPKSYDSVPDPYYGAGDGFQIVYDMIDKACDVIVEKLWNKVSYI